MDITLQVAFIGLVGTLMVAVYNSWQERERKRQEAEISYLSIQIAELYGPLLGLIKQSKSVYEVSLAALPSDGENQLRQNWSDTDWQTWRFLVENYLLKINLQVAELINSKNHLLEDGQMPLSFEKFLKHTAQASCLYTLWKDKNISKKADRNFAPYPETFEEDVQRSLNTLQAKYKSLLNKRHRSSSRR
ncbi:hypothetical protein [Leptolyngbya sp. FACHB-261]|uniref:hypothetical protein n=1 Tax=Leptolyngbya sp. FACHB-261 TaxID=2692806 RepID=UPI0016830061|nr:hypothetical protein [Leptolyngbya sp. FACHB-261]MBD2099595.1 hypothetical protein [Leptolyngbya sp. FACHB-261]